MNGFSTSHRSKHSECETRIGPVAGGNPTTGQTVPYHRIKVARTQAETETDSELTELGEQLANNPEKSVCDSDIQGRNNYRTAIKQTKQSMLKIVDTWKKILQNKL